MPHPLRITISGTESSGKTWLTKSLGVYYECGFSKEYARTYLNDHGAKYGYDDVLKIAEGQLKIITDIPPHVPLHFFDTDLIVIKIWIEEKYGKQVDWINEAIKAYPITHYFLCDIDTPWEFDPLREHPDLWDRSRLFQTHIRVLKQMGCPFSIISGNEDSRLKKSIELVEKLKKDPTFASDSL